MSTARRQVTVPGLSCKKLRTRMGRRITLNRGLMQRQTMRTIGSQMAQNPALKGVMTIGGTIAIFPINRRQMMFQRANPRAYEAKQEPKSKSWAGSVYSYGYRDPNQSGVGQTESVYDADYRVIVPPQDAIPKPGGGEIPKNPSVEAEDDWGLDEDDLLEDDDRPRGGSINLKK